jgi:hypothetical protein
MAQKQGKTRRPALHSVKPSSPARARVHKGRDLAARTCCDDIEGLRNDAERVKKSGAEDVTKHLTSLKLQLEPFTREARQIRKKLDAGLREGLEELVAGWRNARGRLQAHLRLIEAKSTLASAERLAKGQYYVAAESALTTALRLLEEVRTLTPSKDAHLTDLVQKMERAVERFKRESQAAAARLQSVVAMNERLLAHLEK